MSTICQWPETASDRKQKYLITLKRSVLDLLVLRIWNKLGKICTSSEFWQFRYFSLSTFKTAKPSGKRGSGCKMCNSVFSESFIWSIFCSGRYLDSNKTDECIKLCASSNKLSVHVSDFWETGTCPEIFGKLPNIKLYNTEWKLKKHNRIITKLQTTYQHSHNNIWRSAHLLQNLKFFPLGLMNLLKTKRNLLYIRSQFVPRCKHFPPRL